jgi:GNAT superfamily N-acetyltransferase
VSSDSIHETRIVAVTEKDLPAISDLAGVIWRACYPGIISGQQIEYMLGRMYTFDILRDELEIGIRFQTLWIGPRLAGFSSYGPAPRSGSFKLHKLYLHPELHGSGFGTFLLRHCEQESVKLGANRLVLNVNKRNEKAIRAYRRNDFTIVESVILDIGQGFVIDDYVMAKDLPLCHK